MDEERQQFKPELVRVDGRVTAAQGRGSGADTTKVEDASRRWLIARIPIVLEMRHTKHVAVLGFEQAGQERCARKAAREVPTCVDFRAWDVVQR